MTVPAVCAGELYLGPNSPAPGTNIYFATYPDFPNSDVLCCLYCHQQQLDCIASFFDTNIGICEVLVIADGTSTDPVSQKTPQCPLGIYDFAFGQPDVMLGNIFPGPCGM